MSKDLLDYADIEVPQERDYARIVPEMPYPGWAGPDPEPRLCMGCGQWDYKCVCDTLNQH